MDFISTISATTSSLSAPLTTNLKDAVSSFDSNTLGNAQLFIIQQFQNLPGASGQPTELTLEASPPAVSASPSPSTTTNEPWPMHPIATTLRGANSLGPADVNGDGYLDYVTSYQFDQVYGISLHPGEGGDSTKQPWQQVVAFKPSPLLPSTGINPENAAFGDFDGDGILDIVGAQGWSANAFFDGSQPGIRLIWGTGATSWSDGGIIQATRNRGHFHYVRSLDVNGDGRLDIVAGGRKEGDNGIYAGIIWLEAPPQEAPLAVRRDLSQWQIHAIDPNQFTGFGFEFVDLDGDGDQDIVLANNDFDTPASEVGIFWYENPGASSSQVRSPWTKHIIDKININDPADPLRELYTKAQVAIGDLDQDGNLEIVLQTKSQFLVYNNPTNLADPWSLTTIAKPPEIQWIGRAIELQDMNQDGRLDIVGMLVHENQILPADKGAVFWMQNNGNGLDNFTLHVIKWGSGKLMPITLPDFGEKWDQMYFDDVDRDGDLDIVANEEEWWVDKPAFRPFWLPASQPVEAASVVWFENRSSENAPAFEQQPGGSYLIEAENFSRLESPTLGAPVPQSNTLTIRASYDGFSGTGYLQDLTSLPLFSPKGQTSSLGAEYDIKLQQDGVYYLWVRRYVPSSFGTWLGGTSSNSTWLAIDGNVIGNSFLDPVLDNGSGNNTWKWVRSRAIALDSGEHVITLRAREGGYAVDQLVLAQPGWNPPADFA